MEVERKAEGAEEEREERVEEAEPAVARAELGKEEVLMVKEGVEEMGMRLPGLAATSQSSTRARSGWGTMTGPQAAP